MRRRGCGTEGSLGPGERVARPLGSAYNGRFGDTCYHPVFMFNQFGDLE